MEILDGGDILQRVLATTAAKHELTESSLKPSFKSFIIALNSLHQKGYIHRDLKVENCVAVDKSDASSMKLIDFGLMVKLPEGGVVTQGRDGVYFGSPGYLAPESIDRFEYSTGTDVWQAGCIFYIMLFGHPVRLITYHGTFITHHCSQAFATRQPSAIRIGEIIFKWAQDDQRRRELWSDACSQRTLPTEYPLQLS